MVLIVSNQIFSQDLIIKNINILPMTENVVLYNQSVWIKNGKIESIGAFKKLPKHKNTKIINGKGKYLMPGLVDMHVHLPEENKVEKLLFSNIAAGVTRIRVMNSQVDQLDLREKLNSKKGLISPTIHYSHFVRRNERFSESQTDSLVQEVKSKGINFIKLLSLSDEETFDNLSKAANEHQVIFGGHYPVYRKDEKAMAMDIEKVIKSNFKSIEHLAGYIWLQSEEEIEKAIQLTKEYSVFNCPTLDWDVMAYDLQYPEKYKNRLTYQFLPEEMTKDWKDEYLSKIEAKGGSQKAIEAKEKHQPTFDLKKKILKALYENDCLLLIGGDAGSAFQVDGFNVYEEMMHWKNIGIDNYTILKSATITPSQFFQEENIWGTIEEGKIAEMIILTKNPLENIENITTIEMTIVQDEIYNNPKLINQL